MPTYNAPVDDMSDMVDAEEEDALMMGGNKEQPVDEELDYEQCSALASNLAEILQEQFEGRIFPETPTEESIEDSIGKPLFVVFRALCEMTDSDPHRVHILQLLAELYTLQPRLGKLDNVLMCNSVLIYYLNFIVYTVHSLISFHI